MSGGKKRINLISQVYQVISSKSQKKVLVELCNELRSAEQPVFSCHSHSKSLLACWWLNLLPPVMQIWQQQQNL